MVAAGALPRDYRSLRRRKYAGVMGHAETQHTQWSIYNAVYVLLMAVLSNCDCPLRSSVHRSGQHALILTKQNMPKMLRRRGYFTWNMCWEEDSAALKLVEQYQVVQAGNSSRHSCNQFEYVKHVKFHTITPEQSRQVGAH